MSIIERSNPLNLQYRICIVTGASSPLGTVICKILLKANAFVFGVDSRPKHESLNDGTGMHFGFQKCDITDHGSGESVLEAVREKYRSDRVDVLVNVASEGTKTAWSGLTDLSEAVGQVMAQEGSGCMVNVLGDASDDGGLDFTKKNAKDYSRARCNAIVPSKGMLFQPSVCCYRLRANQRF